MEILRKDIGNLWIIEDIKMEIKMFNFLNKKIFIEIIGCSFNVEKVIVFIYIENN